MAKTFDDKKIIFTMDRVGRAYGTKIVLKDISISQLKDVYFDYFTKTDKSFAKLDVLYKIDCIGKVVILIV